MASKQTIKEHYAYAAHYFQRAADHMLITGVSNRPDGQLRREALNYGKMAARHVREAGKKEAKAAARRTFKEAPDEP